MAIKRVLHINTSANNGGAVKIMRSLAHGSDPRQFRTRILSAAESQLSKVIRTGVSFLLSNDFVSGSDICNHPLYQQADIIHLHNIHGAFFPLKSLVRMTQEKSVVWTLHDFWAINGKSAGQEDTYSRFEYPPMLLDRRNTLKEYKKSLYTQCSNLTIVTPSLWMQEKLKKSILKKMPVLHIANGVDTTFFVPNDKEDVRQKGNPAHKKTILTVASRGLANPYKGGQFIRACAEALPNYEFVIVGAQYKNIRRNIIEVPYQSERELRQYYQTADLLFAPSTTETFGLVVAESMASGLPVVTSSISAFQELIRHKKDGYLMQSTQLKDMIAGIEWTMSLSEKNRHKLTHRARKKVVTKYNLKKMVQKYQQLYRTL
jgi:protein O-GlcNAc transferase